MSPPQKGDFGREAKADEETQEYQSKPSCFMETQACA